MTARDERGRFVKANAPTVRIDFAQDYEAFAEAIRKAVRVQGGTARLFPVEQQRPVARVDTNGSVGRLAVVPDPRLGPIHPGLILALGIAIGWLIAAVVFATFATSR